MNKEKEFKSKGLGVRKYHKGLSCQNGMSYNAYDEPKLNVKDYISITKDVILHYFKNIPNPKRLFQEYADITRMLK